MTVKELVLLLTKYPANMKVIISKDVEASGFGFVDKIEVGCFEMTDYGNDFFPEQESPLKGQSKAVCLHADVQSWLTDEIMELGRDTKTKKGN